MRRILIFSLAYYPRFIGGAEVAVKEITDRISLNEVEFDMVTLRKHAPAFERVGNVNVYRVGAPWFGKNNKSSRIFPLSKILYVPLAFLKAVRLHRARPYDAIWSIMASYAGFAAALFKSKFPTVPFVLTIQEGDNFERREGALKPFFGKIFKRADRIQAISNYLADWSRKMGATCPISVVPNAVDCELFSKPVNEETARDLKAKLGKKENDIFLITTSRLVPKNAVGDIIEALAYLPANVKLLILGTGYEEAKLKVQASRFESLRTGRSLAEPRIEGQSHGWQANSSIESRVRFLGFIPHKEMPAYLQVSDIFVRPSLSEGLGNSFLEAMAAGIPVIATPVGGIVDFLKEGETGLFCEVRNPRSIAQKVEKLIKDKESRDYIVRNAKKMVEERYQWNDISKKMREILAA